MTFRQIHTQIWKDDYFLELTPEEKLLFIYLFSNENTSLTGLYKISMRVICFETGLEQNKVIDTLKKFEQAGKVCYEGGLMWVVNMRKYHETRSPKIKTAIDNDLAKIPDCPLKKRYLSGKIPYVYPMDTDAYHTIPDTDQIIPDADKVPASSGEVFQTYQNEIGVITKTISDEILDMLEDIPGEYFIRAFQEAAKNNKRSWAYAKAILKRMKVEGITSPKSNGHKPPEKRMIQLTDGSIVEATT